MWCGERERERERGRRNDRERERERGKRSWDFMREGDWGGSNRERKSVRAGREIKIRGERELIRKIEGGREKGREVTLFEKGMIETKLENKDKRRSKSARGMEKCE